MNFSRILHSTLGVYIISLILGLGLATLFKKSCNNDRCRIFRAPHPKKINEKLLRFDEKCYKYEFNAGRCNGNKRIVEFA